MKFVIILFSMLVSAFALNAAPADYSDIDSWGKESPMCANGKTQSPIDIQKSSIGSVVSKDDANDYLEVSKKMVASNISKGGVTFKKGSMVASGKSYSLKGLHFHAPSEHTLKGKSYALEGHFVHADKDGNLAVIGVLFKLGKENPVLAQILATEVKAKKLKIDFVSLIPTESAFYNYSGSLTTPPCTDNVNWFVMENVLEVSEEQVKKFQELLGAEKTNRPVQKLYDRKLKKSYNLKLTN